jgi:predicted acyl esterase
VVARRLGRGDGDTLGQISFGSKTAAYYRANIELPFFNYYLKDKGRLNLAEAVVFETGGNKWHSYPQWPPAGARARNLYLQAGGKLAFGGPADRSDEAFDDYVSDPAKPVPYTAEVTTTEGHLFMVEDQRFVWGDRTSSSTRRLRSLTI